MIDPLVIDPLVRTARARPDDVALIDGAQRWTWRELLVAADVLAGHLLTQPHERVALLALDSGDAVVAINAVRRAGMTLVPLQRRLTTTGLVQLLERSRTSLLIHDAPHASVAAQLADARPSLMLLALPVVAATVPAPIAGPAPGRDSVDASAVGAVVFTSGTTAASKGVLLTHANLFASAGAWAKFLGARPDDHWLAALPLSHVAGLGVVLRSACSGARLTVQDRFDPTAVRRSLAEDGVTHVSLVPTQLVRVLDEGPVVAPVLRALLLGGAPIPAALVTRAIAAGRPVGPTYGMTEAASGVTALAADEARAHPGSSGRALPGMRVRVMLDRDMPAPIDVEGHISVSGPSVFQGYDEDDVGTRAALDGGWLHTGDRGRLDANGLLTITGRDAELIVSGGENISPVAVESVMLAHPDIADVAVVAWPDPTWGSMPAAAIVARPGADVDVEDIARFARDRLPAFSVPSTIEPVEAIPRTASGKVIRRDVRRMLASIATDLFVERPDGARIHVRRRGLGPVLVLLHATLANARELDPLAVELSREHTILAIDRRSAGSSEMPPGDVLGPIEAGAHIDDVIAVLDALAPGERVFLVGHSYGGCVGLEIAARHPGRIAGAFLFEPPYLGVLPGGASDSRLLGQRITDIARRDGSGAAALAFLETVNGPGATRRLPAPVLAQFEREGRSAVADAALAGFDPAGLQGIRTPIHVGLGGRSRGPYAAVAGSLQQFGVTVHTHHFPTLGHGGPVSRPTAIAPVVIALAGSPDAPASAAPPPGGSP